IEDDDREIVFTFKFTSNLGNASKGYMLIQAGFSSTSAEAAKLATPINTIANISTATGGSDNGLITLELSDYACVAEEGVNAGTTITATFTYSGDCTQNLEKVYVYFSVTVSSTAIA
ncbi:MAG: hypothetical protein PHQ62_03340, partial [Clostridia bacterium]|nr:hypothetical protein [Clostridia bacterium]